MLRKNGECKEKRNSRESTICALEEKTFSVGGEGATEVKIPILTTVYVFVCTVSLLMIRLLISRLFPSIFMYQILNIKMVVLTTLTLLIN
jgi:hypothetical protein